MFIDYHHFDYGVKKIRRDSCCFPLSFKAKMASQLIASGDWQYFSQNDNFGDQKLSLTHLYLLYVTSAIILVANLLKILSHMES